MGSTTFFRIQAFDLQMMWTIWKDTHPDMMEHVDDPWALLHDVTEWMTRKIEQQNPDMQRSALMWHTGYVTIDWDDDMEDEPD